MLLLLRLRFSKQMKHVKSLDHPVHEATTRRATACSSICSSGMCCASEREELRRVERVEFSNFEMTSGCLSWIRYRQRTLLFLRHPASCIRVMLTYVSYRVIPVIPVSCPRKEPIWSKPQGFDLCLLDLTYFNLHYRCLAKQELRLQEKATEFNHKFSQCLV